jgi:NAD(P)-dependent dehydrogenase (short-subunit alcohol dehydrogenase family)
VLHQVLAQLGKVDGVANCVGSVLAQPAASTALSDLQATLATNLYTSFNIVKAAAQVGVAIQRWWWCGRRCQRCVLHAASLHCGSSGLGRIPM